jgi:O-antigen ligase/cytochrome c-type biogenesis protein CcmH/NrfG
MSLIAKSNAVEFFGPVSWANFVDWLITLCLGTILIITTLELGGVRPETQADVLPLFGLALALHGLWVVLQQGKAGCQLSGLPFLFLPFSIWACVSVLYFSPVPWRGTYELIYLAGALIFLWVALNNLRTRSHFWVLLLCALVPAAAAVFRAYYQFSHSSSASLAEFGLDYPLEPSADYAGRSTGFFADPESYAAYVLILLPCVWIAAVVPRLPLMLRIFCYYTGVVLLVSLLFAETYWAWAMVAVLMVVVPFFCFKKMKRRLLLAGGGIFLTCLVFAATLFANPLFGEHLTDALSEEGEGIRFSLWQDTLSIWSEQFLFGQGAGAYSWAFEKTNPSMQPFVPVTPHNDFLLILAQYGLFGALLLFGPLGFVVYRAYRKYGEYPFVRRFRRVKVYAKMPIQRFFLSIGLCGMLAFGMAAFFISTGYVPALMLLGLVLLVICAKYSFAPAVALPRVPAAGMLYFLTTVVAGFLFVVYGGARLESQGLEVRASQELEHLVAARIPITGDREQLDAVIHRFTDAVLADPENADAWIGLSAAICQTYYRNPGVFQRTGARALAAAERAYELCPEYWRSSAQLGMAHALRGDLEAAGSAFARAVKMAPNSSAANYYFAAFLTLSGGSSDLARHHIDHALAIDPDSPVAQQLQRRISAF